ncbi:Cytochrome P450 704C1 [Apostasia shenzhenica]|uniref:noroxomaritidine synthase n=1 Tax=Apostasia shenzhenica TaxID=1088818 RepID=A0A2I0AY54_9ASPA|nr:Cytochrome P450 704C1 [Apostasia shenzhenica]
MELHKEADLPTMAAKGAAVILFALCFLSFLGKVFLRKKRYPPVAGTIFHQFLNLHRLQEFQTELSRRYKTFRILTPFCNYVYTVDPVNVEYILKTNFPNFGKGSYNYVIMRELLGDGIFAVDGEKWRHQRKVASFEFSAKVLRDYSSVIFRNNAATLFELMSQSALSNEIIDLQDLLMKSTMDSIFKVGFGVELDTLKGSNIQGRIFSKAFDDSSSQTLRRYFDVFWKIKRLLNIGSEAQMKKNIKVIDDFVYKVIDEKLKLLSRRKDDSMIKEDILSRLMMEREMDPDNISIKYLRDIILNFVIAGKDTTAGTLSWFFFMLCKHPDVQEKAAQGVRGAIAVKENLSIKEFSKFLTEEALISMHYLHACLTETLRLYPAVPIDVKYCFSDDKLPDGFDLKKGDMVNYQPYAMGRMKFLWGHDAEVFRPERWLNVDGLFEPKSPFKFTAFQAGPRICLGKDFAYRQMKIFAATLLYYFKMELSEDRAVNYRPMLTLQIDGGLHLRAFHRYCCPS